MLTLRQALNNYKFPDKEKRLWYNHSDINFHKLMASRKL